MSGYYEDSRNARSYDAEQAERDITTEDIPFYIDLARQSHDRGLPVLELGAGTGRVTVPIARTGVDIVGLDSSDAMLEVAREKSRDLANVRWVRGDMADFELDERFGLVIIPFRSFLLLTTVAQQLSCLRAIHRHLAEGGRLALNFFNPDLRLMAAWMGDRKGLWERVESTRERERWLTTRYETSTQQLQSDEVLARLSDDGAIVTRIERNLHLRYVFRYEMEHLLALTGFTVEALHGWFDRRPFTDESPEMVWVATPT